MSLSLSEIIETSIPSDEALACGIYFLIHQEAVVYVGQSKKNIASRIGAHAADKVFDRYFILPCSPEEVDEMESHYIAKFIPRYNKAVKETPSIRFVKVVDPSSGVNTQGTVDFVIIGDRMYINLDSVSIKMQQP